MMPVVKNDYHIYPSCPSTRHGMGTPQSSRDSSLSGSPTGASSFMSSPRNSQTPAFLNTPKSGSETSLHKFHSKLLDKLKKTFRSKDGSDENQGTSSTVAIRWCYRDYPSSSFFLSLSDGIGMLWGRRWCLTYWWPYSSSSVDSAVSPAAGGFWTSRTTRRGSVSVLELMPSIFTINRWISQELLRRIIFSKYQHIFRILLPNIF